MLPIPSRSIRLKGRAPSQAVVVTAIAADPRGDLVVAAGNDHLIRVLKASNLSTVQTLEGHRDLIRTLAFDPDGSRLVSAGNDGQLILWDRDNSFEVRQKMQGTPALACVRFSPKLTEMAAVGFDNEVFVIGRRDQQVPTFECDCRDLRAVAYRDDNRILAVGGRSGDLHLFDTQSGRMLSDHALHRGRIHDAIFHDQSNNVISVSEDGSVSVFDTQQLRLKHRIDVTTGKLFSVAVINSRMVAVAGSDNDIRIVNTDDGRVVRTLEGHTGSVPTLKASSGFLFSGSYDATLRRWAMGDIDSSQERIAEKDPSIDR
ncbi:MAG: WD40 repeat domain-containing protein [Rubripirellula sp.]